MRVDEDVRAVADAGSPPRASTRRRRRGPRASSIGLALPASRGWPRAPSLRRRGRRARGGSARASARLERSERARGRGSDRERGRRAGASCHARRARSEAPLCGSKRCSRRRRPTWTRSPFFTPGVGARRARRRARPPSAAVREGLRRRAPRRSRPSSGGALAGSASCTSCGRTPSVTSRPRLERAPEARLVDAATATVRPARDHSRRAALSGAPSTKFIAGLPRKLATNRVRGRA